MKGMISLKLENAHRFLAGICCICMAVLVLCWSDSAAAQSQVTISVRDSANVAQSGLSVYAFDGTTYMNVSGTTDASGIAVLMMPAGSYRFRIDKNGTQFFTNASNHCTTPACTEVDHEIPENVSVTVTNPAGSPEAGLTVYAFDGTTYTNKSALTNAAGIAIFTLVPGNYRFRIDKDGTQFFTAAANHCAAPGCTAVAYEVPANITVSVTSSAGGPDAGLTVYAFNGAAYTNKSAVTDAAGQATFTLVPGSYRFRIDKNGTQFFTDENNHCTAPGCTAVAYELPANITVSLTNSAGGPEAGLTVYAFNGTTYTNKSAVTNSAGEANFTLLPGNYRFRIDKSGTQFFTAANNHCEVPGCTAVTYDVPANITVTVTSSAGGPEPGLKVYAYDGSTYTNKSAVTDDLGQATFTLLPGNYRFRVDKNGTQFFTSSTNHCVAPGCTAATYEMPANIAVTVKTSLGALQPGVTVYALDGSTYTNKSAVTNESGIAVFTLLPGSYRFRADQNGTQYFSNAANHCAAPGCESSLVLIPVEGSLDVSVSVRDHLDQPVQDVAVEAFSGDNPAGLPATTNALGVATIPLPAGSYRFRVLNEGSHVYSGLVDHCTVPDCVAASLTLPSPGPQISFINPAPGSSVSKLKLPLQLTVSAHDLEDGDISEEVVFSSDVDGAVTNPSYLSVGAHILTATVTDLDGHIASVQSSITITGFVPYENTVLDLTLNNNTAAALTLSNGNLQINRNAQSTTPTGVFASTVRSSGKYAFQYKPLSGVLTYTEAGLVPGNTATTGRIGFTVPGSYVYNSSGARGMAGGPSGSVPGLPITSVGQPLLILVDLDEKKIWVKGEENQTKVLLFDNIVVPPSGMRPAVGLAAVSSMVVNFTGPFEVPLDPGFVPWAGNFPAESAPTVTINTPAAYQENLDTDLIPFIATATDLEEGDISSKIVYSSSKDGIITPPETLSGGYHVVTASVTDYSGIRSETKFPEILVQPVTTILDPTINNSPVQAINGGLTIQGGNSSSVFTLIGNSVRKQGRYMFQYTPAVISGATGGVTAANFLGVGVVPAHSTSSASIGAGYPGSYAYYGYSTRSSAVITTPTGHDALLPYTHVGDPLLFMVDFDAGTIRVKGTDDAASHLLYSGINFPEEGMRPAAAVRYNSRGNLKFDGPFDVVPDPGYLPWGSLADPTAIPAVTFVAPANKAVILQSNLAATEFNVTATDIQDGDLSDEVSFISSVDGAFDSPEELSVGIHTVYAIVADSEGNTGGSQPRVLTIDADEDLVIDTAFTNPAGVTFSGDESNIATVNHISPTSWNNFYAQKARNAGKFAFEYKVTRGAAGTSRAGIGAAALFLGGPGIAPYSWAYMSNARKVAANAETSITTPITEAGESLLFMVNLDAGTIRIRGTGDTISKEIFNGLAFPDSGMVPGFSISSKDTQIEFDFDGPFAIPLDPGYLPWESTINREPTLDLTSPGTEFIFGQSIALHGMSFDPDEGDISSTIIWSSSLGGALGTGASISPSLSIGNHTITASVTDGLNTTVTETLTLTVLPIPNNRPQVSISSPMESQVSVGIPVILVATSIDVENGDLSNTIQWSSDKNGVLGSGASLSVSTLSQGMHVLTATSTDSAGAKGIARTTLLVGDPTPIASYAYNALGQRVSKTDEASETSVHFIYDPEGRLIAEIDAATGDTLREYIYVNGQQVAIVDDTHTQDEAIYFVHNDHLGTPQKLTDANRQVVWAADYEPFGKATVATNTIGSGNDFNTRFPGQYEDKETQLHHNYFRDLDPITGRYVQSDPVGLYGGLNTYQYALGNPIVFYDPYGLWVPPSLPQGLVDFGAGLGDALLWGFGDDLRQLTNVSGGIDVCSGAYSAGAWTSFGFGGSRLAYAGLAKAGARLAPTSAAASAFREKLKRPFRLFLGKNWRPPNLAGKTDEQLRRSAGKTNPFVNAYGAGVAGAGAAGALGCVCL